MTTLNEKNEQTKRIIHLLITEKCNRTCPYCCNKQYDMSTIENVTEQELSECETIFLTGGEPFAYADPCDIAKNLKLAYPNIKNVFVYTNAFELSQYLKNYDIHDIDGLTISIKNAIDEHSYNKRIVNNKQIQNLKSNRVYLFEYTYGKGINRYDPNFDVRSRKWQQDFRPAPDSIFRKMIHESITTAAIIYGDDHIVIKDIQYINSDERRI